MNALSVDGDHFQPTVMNFDILKFVKSVYGKVLFSVSKFFFPFFFFFVGTCMWSSFD